jgi:hypothetical protein
MLGDLAEDAVKNTLDEIKEKKYQFLMYNDQPPYHQTFTGANKWYCQNGIPPPEPNKKLPSTYFAVTGLVGHSKV